MPKKLSVILLMFAVGVSPCLLFARDNILTTGIGVSLDYDDRQYTALEDDPETDIDERLTPRAEDDYRRFVLTPLLGFISATPRDSFEFRFQPDLSYDLIDSETYWNPNVYIAADRFINRSWQLGASNQFLRSDEYLSTIDTETAEPGQEPTETTVQPTDPELSPDTGRTRYWRNTLNLYSEYFYGEESLVRLDFNYIVLRYDDTLADVEQEDYDRYEARLLNEHRFSSEWSTTVDLRFIQGDFEPADPEAVDALLDEIAPEADTSLTYDDLSTDLKEYRLLLQVDNASISHNPLFVQFYYIGTKYDEFLRDDSDIYQMRFNWRRDFSSRLYTVLGIGPSYEKTENRDANWAGNGIAELHYATDPLSYDFTVEKRYDVVNFDGTRRQGLVDFWDVRFSIDYNLSRNLTLTGRLGYLYEDEQDPVAALDRILELDDERAALEDLQLTELEEYHTDNYIAGIGLSYMFWQYYTARVDYTFTRQETDRLNDNYDDHRIVLTLSWQKDVLRW